MNDETVGLRRSLADIRQTPFDVLVIGGGIVGAGVARDAACRGLRTLLVEQSDFASGTSSRSSRLLHGGIRYLAQGRIGLVREASVEKMRLSRIAPHLCHSLPFLFPVWKGEGWSRWQLGVGVFLYDMLCGGRNLGRSATLNATEVLQLGHGLRTEGLTGATRHYDALTNDARLVFDSLRSAEEAGATLRNYTAFVSASRANTGWTCRIRDAITQEVLEVQAQSVVNAAGAWASRFPQSAIRLRLTKGIHLVIDHARLPLNEAIVLPEGQRILFAIPWGERVILGTTDTDYEGDPAAVHTDSADIQYILGVVNNAFPDAQLGTGDVISTWAGVRPLIAPRKAESGAPSDVSRSHSIRMTEPGWFDVAGGKLTTYRRMAEEVVDSVGKFLGKALPNSPTAHILLAQGPFSGVLPPAIEKAVVAECCRREWAVHLDDVLLRRTSWYFYYRNHEHIAQQACEWMAAELGWDSNRQAAELTRYRAVTESDLVLGNMPRNSTEPTKILVDPAINSSARL